MSVKAFEVVCVDKLQASLSIECVELCGKDLFIGGSEGILQHYLLEEKSQPTSFQAILQQQNDLGVKKAICEVKCASALNRLLVLCDGAIHMISTFDLRYVQNGTKIRNVNTFCVNENPQNSNPFCIEVCLSRKRSVHVYQMTEDTGIHVREIGMGEPALTMAMDGKFICVALTTKYVIVNSEADTVMEVLPFDSITAVPLVIRLNKEEFLVNGPNALGIFVTSAGTSERPPLLWSKSIHAIAFTHPYIVTLNDDSVVVYSILDQKQKQRLHFQGGRHLEHFQGRTLAVAGSCIYALVPVPCGKQVRALLADGNVVEALDLAKHCHWPGLNREQFLKVYRKIQQEAGFIEFSKFNFSHAKELFITGQLDPRELLVLYPELIASEGVFVRTGPPLHELANINQMCQGDQLKIQQCTNFLLEFLQAIQERRNNLKWKKDVDAAILKLYAEFNDPELSSVILAYSTSFSSSESVVGEFVERLERFQRFHALALLTKHWKNDDENALEIWIKLLRGEIIDEAFPGVDFVVEILANLKDENLVWKYSGKVLEQDPEVGAAIFIERIPHNEESENLDKVIEYLQHFPVALVKFLEHLVFQRHSKKEKFHTQLAVMYLEQVQNTKDESEREVCRNRLQDFLRWSSLYRVRFLLGRVEGTQMHLEAAILYGKLEEHDKALRLLVHHLSDSQVARDYCEFYSQGKSSMYKQNLFHQLLSVYLDPVLEPKRREELFHPAIELVNTELAHFDAVSILKLLPDHWSASVVDLFLTKAFRKTLNERRKKQIEMNLAKWENVQCKFNSYLVQKYPILVTEESPCAVCGKLLDESSVARFPSGQVGHVTCCKRVQSTSSSGPKQSTDVKHGS